MHIELIGCTSAGKTTLAQKIVDVGKRQGVDITLGDDFVLQKLHLNWIKSEFMRRRLLEICSACICLWHWQKYREFCRFVFGVIFQAPGSWFYKASLVRIVLRKVGIHEIIRRLGSESQMVLVDNEGIVQAAHSLFVHSNGRLNGDLSNFIKSAPLPDVVAFLWQPESILMERTLKRGHPRIQARSEHKVQGFIKQAAKTFEKLQKVPQVADRLFVINGENNTVTKPHSKSGPSLDRAYDLIGTVIKDIDVQSEPERTTPHAQADTPCLELINRLLDSLHAEGIRYCHWKSNINLKKILNGEEDLDLFVERESVSRIPHVMAQLNFKVAKIKYGPEAQGVTHYYGLDSMTGKLVHVHLFTVLLTGESFVKSHYLPFEKMLLENCDRMGRLAVASKPSELVLFVLRTFIKYGSLPDILRLAGKSAEVRNELKCLLEGTDLAKALSLLRMYCPAVSESLFLSCINAIDENHAFFKKVFLAMRVRRRLRVYAKYTLVQRISAYTQVLLAKLRCILKGNVRNKTLPSGNAVIAFVGPDATGKSTLVAEASRWLGKAFAVRTVHAGKPPSSWLTSPINFILPLARKSAPRHRQKQVRSADPDASRSADKGFSPLYVVRAIALAWDRRQLLAKCRRAADNGEIVICDRYPSEHLGAMDSPRLCERTGSGIRATVHNRLVQFERRLYKSIPAPDITIRLNVSIETAKQRNAKRQKADKHSNDYLEVRHLERHKWDVAGTSSIHDIDTDLPLPDTILNVKKVIWKALS